MVSRLFDIKCEISFEKYGGYLLYNHKKPHKLPEKIREVDRYHECIKFINTLVYLIRH